MAREKERDPREGAASDKDPDPTEKGKSGDDERDDPREADEQGEDSFPASDPPAW